MELVLDSINPQKHAGSNPGPVESYSSHIWECVSPTIKDRISWLKINLSSSKTTLESPIGLILEQDNLMQGSGEV